MWRGEMRAVISPLCLHVVDCVKWWYAWELLLTRFWNFDIALWCLQTPRQPVKKLQRKWESNVAGKKSSLLGLQPEVAFTMNEMRRCRPGIWNKVAVASYCSCFQNQIQVWVKFCCCTYIKNMYDGSVMWPSEDSWLHCGSEDYFSYFVVEWSNLCGNASPLSIPA
jgi:hypothetical protein